MRLKETEKNQKTLKECKRERKTVKEVENNLKEEKATRGFQKKDWKHFCGIIS